MIIEYHNRVVLCPRAGPTVLAALLHLATAVPLSSPLPVNFLFSFLPVLRFQEVTPEPSAFKGEIFNL